MSLSMWYDLCLLTLLSVLFIYIFFTVRITNLHKVYFIFHFFIMLWPLCQFATHVVQDLEVQFFFVSLSFASSLMLASGWLLFTLFLAGNTKRLNRKSVGLLFTPALLVSICVMINPLHSFASPAADNYINRTYGPLFWITLIVLTGYFLSSLVVLLRTLRSPASSRSLKKQIRIVLWGICVLVAFAGTDVILNVVLQDFLPIIPGLTSLGMFITDLFFVFVITRYKVFDLVTIAHEDIINTIPHGILVLDEEESVIETNRALHLFVDIEVGDTFDIETLLSSVRTGDNLQHFIAQYKLRETDLSEIELFSEQRNLHFILQTSPIFDAKRIPLGHIFIFRDVTQERSLVQELNRQNELLHEQNRSLDRTRLDLSLANRRLEELALTDSLTHCYNRYYLTQRLSQELNATAEQRLPFSLILFDIDFFKTINDRYGHVAGDEVLYRTAQAVKQCIRSTDILARYGGEEFMLYLPYTNNKTAKKIAEQVRYAVESNMVHLEQLVEPISVTVSVGVLSIQDLHHVQIGENMKEYLNFLFSEVDKPLYRAKKNGRNRVELADMTPLPDWPFKQSAHNN